MGSRPSDAALDVMLAIHRDLPDGTTDDRLLADALMAAGARIRLAVWNDPRVDWSRAAHTAIRSTWDYHLQPDAWFAWLDAVERETTLVNPPPVLRWNSRKRYLLDLEAAGVAVVPTLHVVAGALFDVAAASSARGWTDVVIKPAIGASAKGAERFAEGDIASRGQAHLDALLACGDALIQPFQPAVDDERERSVVVIGGAMSHAFTKPPFMRGVGDGLGETLHPPTAEELTLAARAVAAVPGPVTYARVDMVPTPDGPRLMELELIEPDLGLRLFLPAVTALAHAILEAGSGGE
jgi:glutathione synthase/RimK-type ligase-like ATP-grasp enzyme